MPNTYRFSFPTLIHFGPGASRLAARHLSDKGLKRPLVVTDKGLSSLALCNNFVESLSNNLKPALFDGIIGNPVKSQVLEGVKAFRAHQADSIVGFGGGAALDVAKAIALMIHHPGDLFDYEDEKPGARPITGEIPYWIALPTTSGTGSEVGRSSVVSDDKNHIKKIIFSPKLLAQAVFADPELTLELPGRVTAATGMDALTHCVEAFLAKGYHPICDGIALEGARLAALNLAKAFHAPSNLDARSSMMMASMMGAIAFQKGLGVTHSCAHALSTVADLHHGLANGIMIDHALEHNWDKVADRFRRLEQAMDICEKGFLKWLIELKRSIGIPLTLSPAGIRREHINRLVEVATLDACHPYNPVPCTAQDFERIFLKALG